MKKNVFITGTSRGLGYALAREFALNGFKVYAIVTSESGRKKMNELDFENIIPIISDVSDNKVIDDIKKIVKNEKIHLVINNAGDCQKPEKFIDTDIDGIEKSFQIHVMGAIRVVKALFQNLDKNASIINMSSRFGSIKKIASGELDHIPCSYAYRIAKGSQTMFTQCLAREFDGTDIKVCSLHPGKLKTEMAAPDADHEPEEAAARIFELKDKIQNGKFYSLFEGEFEI
jgi:NAD(P)-dependent dehydrogenase (short-subunit alcohol dehydrogenase family)